MSRCTMISMGLFMAVACTDGGFGVTDEGQSWLEGRVVDEAGASAEGVTVFLVRDRVAERSVETDARGRFRIGPSVSGDIDLVVNGGFDRGAWQTFNVPAEGVVSLAPIVLGTMAHRTDLLGLRGVGYEECIAEVLPPGIDEGPFDPGWRVFLDSENPDVGLAWRWPYAGLMSTEALSGFEQFRWDARTETVLTPMPEFTLAQYTHEGGVPDFPYFASFGRMVIIQTRVPDGSSVVCRFFDLRHGRLVHEVMDSQGCMPLRVWEDEEGFTLIWSHQVPVYMERMDWDGRLLKRIEPEPTLGWVLLPSDRASRLLMQAPRCPHCETIRVAVVEQTLEPRVVGDFPGGWLSSVWLADDDSFVVGVRREWPNQTRVWLLDNEVGPRLIYEGACDGRQCPEVRALLESEEILLLTEPQTPGFLALDLTTFEVRPHFFEGLDDSLETGCVDTPHQDCLVSRTEEGLVLWAVLSKRFSEVVDGRVVRTILGRPRASNDCRWEGVGWLRSNDRQRQIYVGPKGGQEEDFQPLTFLSLGHDIRDFSVDGRWVYASVDHARCSMTRIPLP